MHTGIYPWDDLLCDLRRLVRTYNLNTWNMHLGLNQRFYALDESGKLNVMMRSLIQILRVETYFSELDYAVKFLEAACQNGGGLINGSGFCSTITLRTVIEESVDPESGCLDVNRLENVLNRLALPVVTTRPAQNIEWLMAILLLLLAMTSLVMGVTYGLAKVSAAPMSLSPLFLVLPGCMLLLCFLSCLCSKRNLLSERLQSHIPFCQQAARRQQLLKNLTRPIVQDGDLGIQLAELSEDVSRFLGRLLEFNPSDADQLIIHLMRRYLIRLNQLRQIKSARK